jgi:hypothetical protein
MTRAALWMMCVVFLLHGFAKGVDAQAKPDGPDIYGARNKFGVMAEYSNDSSRIVLGRSDNVKLGSVGIQYQLRLVANRYFVFSHAAEFRPVILESIPTVTQTTVNLSGGRQLYVSTDSRVEVYGRDDPVSRDRRDSASNLHGATSSSGAAGR